MTQQIPLDLKRRKQAYRNGIENQGQIRKYYLGMDGRDKEHRKGAGASVSFPLILAGIVCSSWRKKDYPIQGAIKLVTTLISWIHTSPWDQTLRHLRDDTAKLWSVRLRSVITWCVSSNWENKANAIPIFEKCKKNLGK